MSELTEALEEWRQAVRDLDATMPWTAQWLRARLIEEERRLAYHALANGTAEAEGIDVEPPVESKANHLTRLSSR
jgi:hypothetical protein